uniref:hypothetical protein n=1 Tax=Bartonella sp. MR100HLJHH TaxID=3243554 RepID=UPI0035CF9242
MRKYELTDETKEFHDARTDKSKKLYRIRALRDFRNIKKGYLGGYIQKEDNLSHEGDCWVWHKAMVCGDAKIFGNAQVFERAKITGRARIYENAKVCGEAYVEYGAQIYCNAQIYGEARVLGHVYGNARVYGDAY